MKATYKKFLLVAVLFLAKAVAVNAQSVQYSDTTSMLSGYARNGHVLKYIDTAAMLNNLLRKVDTAGMLTNYLKKSDTTEMLSGYARSGQYIPYAGATTNVNLGTRTLSLSGLTNFGSMINATNSAAGGSAVMGTSTGEGIAAMGVYGRSTSAGQGVGVYGKADGTGAAGVVAAHGTGTEVALAVGTNNATWNTKLMADGSSSFGSNMSVLGTITTTGLIKSGGLSTQYWAADGTLQTITSGGDTRPLIDKGYVDSVNHLNVKYSDTSAMLSGYARTGNISPDGSSPFQELTTANITTITANANLSVAGNVSLGKTSVDDTLLLKGRVFNGMRIYSDYLANGLSTYPTIKFGGSLSWTMGLYINGNSSGIALRDPTTDNWGGLVSNNNLSTRIINKLPLTSGTLINSVDTSSMLSGYARTGNISPGTTSPFQELTTANITTVTANANLSVTGNVSLGRTSVNDTLKLLRSTLTSSAYNIYNDTLKNGLGNLAAIKFGGSGTSSYWASVYVNGPNSGIAFPDITTGNFGSLTNNTGLSGRTTNKLPLTSGTLINSVDTSSMLSGYARTGNISPGTTSPFQELTTANITTVTANANLSVTGNVSLGRTSVNDTLKLSRSISGHYTIYNDTLRNGLSGYPSLKFGYGPVWDVTFYQNGSNSGIGIRNPNTKYWSGITYSAGLSANSFNSLPRTSGTLINSVDTSSMLSGYARTGNISPGTTSPFQELTTGNITSITTGASLSLTGNITSKEVNGTTLNVSGTSNTNGINNNGDISSSGDLYVDNELNGRYLILKDNNTGKYATLQPTYPLTSNRFFQFPDKSGILILNTDTAAMLSGYVRKNGSASQFLKADGSSDNGVYYKSGDNVSFGTGSFSGTVTSTVGNGGTVLTSANATSGAIIGVDVSNSAGRTLLGTESATAGTGFVSSLANASFLGTNTAKPLQLYTNGIARVSILGSTTANQTFMAIGSNTVTPIGTNFTSVNVVGLSGGGIVIGKESARNATIYADGNWLYLNGNNSGVSMDVNAGEWALKAGSTRAITTYSTLGVGSSLSVGSSATIGSTLGVTGLTTSAGFKTPGGTSSQFLKADGSVDNNTYLTTSSMPSLDYLPLTGGTVTGAITAASLSTTQTGLNVAFSTTVQSKLIDRYERIETPFLSGIAPSPNGGPMQVYFDSSNRLINLAPQGTQSGRWSYANNISNDIAFRYGGSWAAKTALPANVAANQVAGGGWDGSNWASFAAMSFNVGAGGALSSTNHGGRINFLLTSPNSISTQVKIVFDENGAILKGTQTSPVNPNIKDYTTGSVFATDTSFTRAFVKAGGTSSQFLKADGSVDGNSYLTTGSAASNYLPLTGGTLTGTLDGLNANFKGTVRVKAITVTPMGWSDFVFDKKYKLRSLADVAQFINTNHHLPDMPSAKEVEANGISVGDNQALLLRKIEELTLYVIDLKKEINELKEDKKTKTRTGNNK